MAGISSAGRGWKSSCQHQDGGKEGRACDYWFLMLICGEESIPSAMWWWEEGRASLTTALWHGGDMIRDNLQNCLKYF